MTTDIKLTTGGDLAWPPRFTATVPQAVRQRIQIRLNTFLGEWLEDTSVGLPWFAWVETKNLDPAEVQALIRAEIAGVDGVISVDAVAYTRSAVGGVQVTCYVTVDDGTGGELSTGILIDQSTTTPYARVTFFSGGIL